MLMLVGLTISLYFVLTIYVLAKIQTEWAINVIQFLKGNRILNSREIRKHYEEIAISK